MKFKLKFSEIATAFKLNFGTVNNISDGGYERGYAEGNIAGFERGYAEGQAAGGGGAGIDGIPAGYARCDYIQFNDLQTVDTGIICNQDTRLRVVFTRETTVQRYLYGVTDDGNASAVTAYLGGTWRFGAKSASKGSYINANNDIIYTVIVDKTQIHVPNSLTTLSGVSDFETVGTLLLGACRLNGELQAAQFVGKIFHFEIWQGEEKVLNIVPVVSADGIYRFFDMVSKSFFDSITDTPLDGGNL